MPINDCPNKETAHIRSVLNKTSWNNALPEPNDNVTREPYVPPLQCTIQEWKALVQKENSVLQKRFYTQQALEITTPICTLFNLNDDQEQAFNIVTHHALKPSSKQLTLYLGGMGGTGKTCVINAILFLF